MGRHPWPSDIIADLVLGTNPGEMMTNSDLYIAALVLQKDILLEACPIANIYAPCSGLEKTPTVYWSIREASKINPVVVDILHICEIYSRQFLLNP